MFVSYFVWALYDIPYIAEYYMEDYSHVAFRKKKRKENSSLGIYSRVGVVLTNMHRMNRFLLLLV